MRAREHWILYPLKQTEAPGGANGLLEKRYVPPYNIAMIYVGLSDKAQAFAWLDRAYVDRSLYVTWLKYDPQMDSLRSDRRFADMMKRVGLP